jgi:neutral ceramidase
MLERMLRAVAVCLLCLLATRAGLAELRAGTARVDITPAKYEALPMSGYAARTEGHKGIHDNLHVRAIAIDNGTTRAAVLTADLIGFSHRFWDRVTERIASEMHIPRENILLCATHTHSAPSPGTYESIASAGAHAQYISRVEAALIQAVRQAIESMQPARVGAGIGRANVNVNRRALMADGTWRLGINPDGPSDKTVSVVKFEATDGRPIAILSNYAVHGTGMGQENYLISADVPGATSRWVEKHFGDTVVAPWTSGAAGDQCPIYDRSASRFAGVEAIGRILGEEVVRVAQDIRSKAGDSIYGAQKVVSCPGQRFVPGPNGRRDGRFEDADPLPIRLSVLRIGDVALAGVSGEVLTGIGQRLMRESKSLRTIMLTHCNGSSGYIPDDAAYEQVSYEIQTSRFKRGCAENAIVSGLLELMRRRSR